MKSRFVWVLVCFMLFAACAATRSRIKMQQAQNITEEIIESYPKERPRWMEQPPQSDGRYDYFVGHSVKFSSEPAARDEAMSNAIKQFVRFCGVKVSIFDEYLKETTGRTSGILAGVLSKRERERQQAESYVTSIKPKEWYLRRVRILHDGTPIDTGWKASVVIMVPVEEKARVQAYANRVKKEKQTEERREYQAGIEKLKDILQPAGDYYLQAKELAETGKVFQALKLLAEAQGIVAQSKDKPHFIQAKNALQQELGEKVIDRVGILRESLIQGIALVKVGGDGQRLLPGQALAEPLLVRAVCSYDNREIPISLSEIEFRLDGQTIEKAATDRQGVGRLAHYVFDDKYYGNIRIIARLNAKVQREVYFNLFIDKPVERPEERLGVKLSFIYEDDGVPKPMWDGMSLRSRVDYYYAYFSPEQDCYVYIYQVDSSGAVYQIFPNLEYSNAWNPVKKGKDYWVPADDRFYLDDVTGEEKIYFFATKEPATELEGLFARLRRAATRQETASIQGQIKDMLYTRGIGGTGQGNPHPVIAKSGDAFELISRKVESVGPEFMYCLTFMHR
jgi:hypothetical protein